eukprot:s17_g5.t1
MTLISSRTVCPARPKEHPRHSASNTSNSTRHRQWGKLGMGDHAETESGWYHRRPLDPPDAIETAARTHFAGLLQKVFAPCVGSNLELIYSDRCGPHGRVLTELFALADTKQDGSVVFGLVYALLSLPWNRKVIPGYYDYLSLMRALDESDVVVRALAAMSSRFVDLRRPVRERLLFLFADMVEASWPKAESVLLALQRAAPPGNLWPGVAAQES